MTRNEYDEIFNATNKAMKYLHDKGCMTLCDSIPSGYKEAHLIICRVSDTTDAMRKHIAKTYPQARIEYVSRDEVVYGELERQIAFANYRMSL